MPRRGDLEGTRPAGAGPGARWALTFGVLAMGYGGIMALPPRPPDPSDVVGTQASVVTSAAAAPRPVGDPSGATGADPQSTGATPPGPGRPQSGPVDTPVQLAFPELGESAPVQPVAVSDDGNLGIPDDPHVLGWWRSGARPNSSEGAVVIDGHVDSDRYGIGFFVNLRRLRPGQHVLLDDGTGARTRWRVVQSRKYPRDELPADALFSRDGPLRLILITCGGVFDRASHSYPDNLVVLAVPDGG